MRRKKVEKTRFNRCKIDEITAVVIYPAESSQEAPEKSSQGTRQKADDSTEKDA